MANYYVGWIKLYSLARRCCGSRLFFSRIRFLKRIRLRIFFALTTLMVIQSGFRSPGIRHSALIGIRIMKGILILFWFRLRSWLDSDPHLHFDFTWGPDLHFDLDKMCVCDCTNIRIRISIFASHSNPEQETSGIRNIERGQVPVLELEWNPVPSLNIDPDPQHCLCAAPNFLVQNACVGIKAH